jgi:hypothetical protein
MDNRNFVTGFFQTFNPELSKYVRRDSSGQIKTVRKELTKELVENSFSSISQEVISYFSRKGKIDYFGIDIDVHDTKGWNNNTPTEILVERFEFAKKIIGKNPNLIFKSPRGIHAYWFLVEPVPNLILYNRLKELFECIGHIDILPTSNCALRIPSQDNYLNDNLEKGNFIGFESLIRYPNNDIFKNDLGVKNNVCKDKGGKTKKAPFTPLSLELLEKGIMPLKNGQTNNVYIKLVAKYKIYGLDENQAYARFVNLVRNSPGYKGRLLNDLKSRIRTSYKRMTEINLSQMKSLSDLYRDPQTRMLIDFHLKSMNLFTPERGRMRKSMTTFLLNIISWKIACDKIFNNKETAYYWEESYQGSWSRHKEGYYPLPHSLLRKWNSHYDRPLKILKDFGIMKESPYHYSTTMKRCKYYRIGIPVNIKRLTE